MARKPVKDDVLTEAILALEMLRGRRRASDAGQYAEAAKTLFKAPRAEAVAAGMGERLCTCILKLEGVEREIPETTKAECAAAAAEFGLAWDWVCDNRVILPKFVARQLNYAMQSLDDVSKEYESVYSAARNKFYFCVAAMLLCMLGGPFVDVNAGLRLIAQMVGLALAAYGVGVLRVLGYLSPLEVDLTDAKTQLLRIQDELGVDLSQNLGDPVQIMRDLTEDRRKAYGDQLAKVSEQTANAKVQIRKSLFDAYIDLYKSLVPPKGEAGGQGGVQPGLGAGQSGAGPAPGTGTAAPGTGTAAPGTGTAAPGTGTAGAGAGGKKDVGNVGESGPEGKTPGNSGERAAQ